MQEHLIKERLGLRPGTLLLALVHKARALSPDDPSAAFRELGLALPWLGDPAWSKKMSDAPFVPEGVTAFGYTGGDRVTFGFLTDTDATSTDDCPIVTSDGEFTSVLAPDLASFLGLLTVGIGDTMGRGMTDEEWLASRQEWCQGDHQRLERLAELSRHLLTLPGVVVPASPAQITQRLPDQAFSWRDADEPKDPLVPSAAESYAAACGALEEGRPGEALLLARGGAQDQRYEDRSRLVAAQALWALWRKEDAAWVARQLLGRWLEDAWPPQGRPHPRREIGRDEALALVDLVLRGKDHHEWRRKVTEASEVDLPPGDFI